MKKTILHQMYELVNDFGLTIEAAVERLLPGADAMLWDRRVKNYDPAAQKQARKKRAASRRTGGGRRSSRRLTASQIFASQTARATLELVERSNGKRVRLGDDE